MTEPSKTDEITPLCKATFISRNNAIMILWLIAGVLLSGATTAVTWSMTMSSTVIKMQEQTNTNAEKIAKLDSEINRKLDVLIARKELK